MSAPQRTATAAPLVGPDGIYETHVQTTDLPHAMAVYGQTLGLPLAWHL